MNPIRAAIIGVGNCAKSLVEGIEFYRKNELETAGLLRPVIGGYQVTDIEFVLAFDIDRRKVNRRLDEALNAPPNRTNSLAILPAIEVKVERGPTFDGLLPDASMSLIEESEVSPVDVAKSLKSAGAEVVINYLPTGSDEAARWYAKAALEARCSFINCMPTPLSSEGQYYDSFVSASLALLGDDIKSQCGATVVNRALLELLKDRGVRVTKATQINHGGNADHFNLQFRPARKEASKGEALRSVFATVEPRIEMHYEQQLCDHKHAVISIEGEIFGRAAVSMTISLEDEDSPNSSGIVVDCIRSAVLLASSGCAHRSAEICASLMKLPRRQGPEGGARLDLDKVLNEVTRTAKSTKL